MIEMDKAVLIVDDDRSERRMIMTALRQSLDLHFLEAENGKDALRVVRNAKDYSIALVILDLDMPVMNGQETLQILAKNYPDLPVVILTGRTDMQDAVDAMKIGAVDFLNKPVESARLDISARNALKMSLMSQEISRLKRQNDDELTFEDLIGYKDGLSSSTALGRKAAACEIPILITGETGTGKEMFARAIHGESRRKGESFIAVNCGAIPEKLLESTLFGHEKGAFTGAIQKAKGKFQEASGGTIFLDEVGELTLEAQVRLLRVLQQQEVEPVGAAKPVAVNVRIISATNRNLADDIQEGRFREDLYFRLNVLHINLPPLRERKNDIDVLACHFIEKFCASHKVLPKPLSAEALLKLYSHGWPGNVRELENVMNRTMALSDGTNLMAEDFSFIQAVSSDNTVYNSDIIVPVHPDGQFKSYKEIDQEIVTLALAHHEGNITQTARVLGIAKSTLYTKIETLKDLKRA